MELERGFVNNEFSGSWEVSKKIGFSLVEWKYAVIDVKLRFWS